MAISDDLKVTLPSDKEILIARSFKMPPAFVYAAYTQPDQLRKWWGGPAMKMITCDVDLRVGGGYRFVLLAPDGDKHGFRGKYRELEHGRWIVQTFVYEPFPQAWALEQLEFEEVDDGTRLNILVWHQSRANRDAHLKAGMEEGLRLSMNALEDHLATRTMAQRAAG